MRVLVCGPLNYPDCECFAFALDQAWRRRRIVQIILASLKSGTQWTIRTARGHLSFQTDDPWAGFWTQRQTLSKAMKALGFKPR